MSISRFDKAAWVALLCLITVLLPVSSHIAAQSNSPSSRGTRSAAYYSKLFADIVLSIRERYVDAIDADALFESGISGMLDKLDPYSVLLKGDQYDAILESAQGRYEGIGLDVDVRNGEVTIVAPLEGSPAERLGLRPGDQIIRIEDAIVRDMSPYEVNQLLRGSAGTSVRLTISRPGVDESIDYLVERAIIEVHPVQFYGMVDTEVGYVRITKFTERTAAELKSAVNVLKTRGARSLILDLRSNGGGLLDQAVAVVDIFLPENRLIVSTSGQSAAQTRRYSSTAAPVFPDGGLVVLVDSGTASASEVVSGALQDWDRAVIMGQTTYGKGLVQSLLQWPDTDISLKLTTSKYYTPSGRSIHRPDSNLPQERKGERKRTDVLKREASDFTFKTMGGRILSGNGGIVPDVELESRGNKPLDFYLTRDNLFFRYAVDYRRRTPPIERGFKVTDAMLADFREFVHQQGFTYRTNLEKALDRFEAVATAEGSVKSFSSRLKEMRKQVEAEKQREFQASADFIRTSIKRELLRSAFGESAVYEEVVLKDDPQVREAVKLLKDRNRYARLLKP